VKSLRLFLNNWKAVPYDLPTPTPPTDKKYHRHSEIKHITIKKDGKEVKYSGEDVFNGANVFKNGGKVTDNAFYVANRNIVEVILQDGTSVHPKNGYWIEKGAKPVTEKTEFNIKSVFNKGDRFEVFGWIMLKGVDEGLYEVTSNDEDSATFSKVIKNGKLGLKKLRFKKWTLYGSVREKGHGDNNRIELVTSKSSTKFTPTVKFEMGDVVWDKTNKRYGVVLNNYGDALYGDRGEIRLDSDGNQPIFETEPNSYKSIQYNLVKYKSKEDGGNGDISGLKSSALKLIEFDKDISSKRWEELSKDPMNQKSYKEIYKRLLDGEFDGKKYTIPTTYDWDSELTQNSTKEKYLLSSREIEYIDVYDDFIYGLSFTSGSHFDATTKQTIGLLSITSNPVKLAVILDTDVMYSQKIKRRLHKLAESSDRVIVLNPDKSRDARQFPYLLVSKNDSSKYEKAEEFYVKLDTPREALKKDLRSRI
jgi:hypothetical protein